MNKYLIVNKVSRLTFGCPPEDIPLKILNEKMDEYRCHDKRKRLIIVSKRHEYQLYNYTRVLELLYF